MYDFLHVAQCIIELILRWAEDWDAEIDLTVFLKDGYGDFLSVIRAWLESVQPKGPFSCQRSPLQFDLGDEGVSTVYLLHFDNELNEGANTSVQIEVTMSNSALYFYRTNIAISPFFTAFKTSPVSSVSKASGLLSVRPQ